MSSNLEMADGTGTQESIGEGPLTAADAMMEALYNAGVSYIFANLGSDHPAIIESWAKSSVLNRPKPEIIICPHEMVAMSAAHGFAQVTGKAQAVFVHVDVGTSNLGGSVHNAARGRIPALIFAGASPFTMEGEEKGSRNEFIHFIQDVYDQRGLVREYTKWDFEIRSGKNIQQLIYRGLQIAQSDPQGPVYLMAAREVLEQDSLRADTDLAGWQPLARNAMTDEACSELVEVLTKAKNPLIITSYLGRNADAVDELVKLSERLAIPVVEVGPSYVNFPANHDMHLGYQRNEFISDADAILVLDSDAPWIPSLGTPGKDCSVYYIDVDPLKEDIPLWYIPSKQFYKVDSHIALKQMNARLEQLNVVQDDTMKFRYGQIALKHAEQRELWKKGETGREDAITPEWLTACLREVLDPDAIIINETCSYNLGVVARHLPRNKPGTLYASGASSLGWSGGAAIGAKLASPDKDVVVLTGDGTYIFSCPTAVHWVSRKYKAPFLTIIYNNQGWNAPKDATLRVHPKGYAGQNDKFWINFDPSADLAKVAEAAGGAFGVTVHMPEDLKKAIQECMKAVKEGHSAVLNVLVPQASRQEV